MGIDIKQQRLQELTNIAPTVSVKMDMEWLSSTTNTADFQIRLTNTSTSVIKLNALIISCTVAVSSLLYGVKTKSN